MQSHTRTDTLLPLISVIIPCHNVATTIRATLRTVRRQLYPNLEILCIENGSSDETLRILQAEASEDPRLRICQSAPGPGSARMAGIAASQGALIAFLDGDDFLEPDFLSEMQAAMAAEEADLVQCAIRYAWPDRSHVSGSPAGVLSGEACLRAIDLPGALPFLKPQLWNKLYRRSLLEGLTIRDICFEDAECLPRILQGCRRIVVIPEALYTYNKRFSVLTGTGFTDLKRARRYFADCLTSQRPYLDAASQSRRKAWNLPLPFCVHANLGNYLRAVDERIAEASPEDQRQFCAELQTYLTGLRALASAQDLAEILHHVHKMANLPAEAAGMGLADLMAQPAAQTNPAVTALEADMAALDAGFAKDPNLWVFASWGHYDRHTMDNPRAVFEAVKADPAIRKVILLHGACDPQAVLTEGKNVSFLQLETEAGLRTLMQAGVIVTGYSLHNLFGYRRLPLHPGRKILQTWHGIPIKRVGLAVASRQEPYWGAEHSRYWAIPASSALDQTTMARSFAPEAPDRIKLTGLPRHDFLACPESALPADYRSDLDKIRQRLNGRRLVLFAPTWRSDPKDRIDLTLPELQRLDRLFAEHDAVIGFRMHRNMVRHRQSFPLSSDHVIQLGDIPDVNILMRLCDALVTDYSSLYLDYMLLNRPAFLYTPDIARYRRARGLNYGVETFLPHEAELTSFDLLEQALRDLLQGRAALDAAYHAVRARFHAFEPDGRAAARLLQAAGLWPRTEG